MNSIYTNNLRRLSLSNDETSKPHKCLKTKKRKEENLYTNVILKIQIINLKYDSANERSLLLAH